MEHAAAHRAMLRGRGMLATLELCSRYWECVFDGAQNLRRGALERKSPSCSPAPVIWLSVSMPQWRKAELRGIGDVGGGSVAVLENPFAILLERGVVGWLCTGATVWTFVVLEEARPGDDVKIQLRDAETYDENAHGTISSLRPATRR
jgi:hypothetical protein